MCASVIVRVVIGRCHRGCAPVRCRCRVHRACRTRPRGSSSLEPVQGATRWPGTSNLERKLTSVCDLAATDDFASAPRRNPAAARGRIAQLALHSLPPRTRHGAHDQTGAPMLSHLSAAGSHIEPRRLIARCTVGACAVPISLGRARLPGAQPCAMFSRTRYGSLEGYQPVLPPPAVENVDYAHSDGGLSRASRVARTLATAPRVCDRAVLATMTAGSVILPHADEYNSLGGAGLTYWPTYAAASGSLMTAAYGTARAASSLGSSTLLRCARVIWQCRRCTRGSGVRLGPRTWQCPKKTEAPAGAWPPRRGTKSRC